MPCLDEETVLTLLSGQLDDDVLRAVDRHIDACAACRQLVSSLAEEMTGHEARPISETRVTGAAATSITRARRWRG